MVCNSGPKHARAEAGRAGQQVQGDRLAQPLGALTFLCPVLVGWGRDWIPGSGKSAH